jgi:hypothetical protein
MDNNILSALFGLVAALVLIVISLIVAHFTTRSQTRLDLIAEYDKELRTKRLKAYQELWKLTEPLARYSRPAPVTYQAITDLTVDMREWYFQQGGMFLTQDSRDQYFELKASMETLVFGYKTDQNKMQIDDEYLTRLQAESKKNLGVEIDEKYVEFLIDQGSTLRTALATDIGTRNISFVSKKAKEKPPAKA